MAETAYERVLREEKEKSQQKQKGLSDAYGRDVIGSQKRANEAAYENSKTLTYKNVFTGRTDYAFIQKVRGIARESLQTQKSRELNNFKKKYNITDNPTGPIGSFVDIPVRLSDAYGRDAGSKLGKFVKGVDNIVRDVPSGILGEESGLSKGLDAINGTLDAYGKDISKIFTESPWLAKAIQSQKDEIAKELKDINKTFGSIGGWFKTTQNRLLLDLMDILNEWYHDPRTLCCLIKSLVALSMSTIKDQKTTEIIKQMFSGGVKISELTGTVDFFDKMITILRLVRDFMKQELNFNFILNLDIGLSMGKASVGALMAVLTALQQMLRDKIYNKLLTWTNDIIKDERIIQCLPFERLIRLIADWMSGPKGIFSKIEQIIDSYMIGFVTEMQKGFNEAVKTKMLDVTAIDKLITLLTMLRDAVKSFEMCIEADFNETQKLSDDDQNIVNGRINTGRNYIDLSKKIKDNNIRRDIPTDREVRNFIVNRMGESEDFADQVLTNAKISSSGLSSGSPDDAGTDNSINKLSSTIGDCARTLSPERLGKLAKLMSDWEII